MPSRILYILNFTKRLLAGVTRAFNPLFNSVSDPGYETIKMREKNKLFCCFSVNQVRY